MFTIALLIAIALASIAPSPAASPAPVVATAPVDFPDTPPGQCAAAWFKTMASGSADDIRAFETTYRAAKRLAETSVEKRIARLPDLRKEFGTLTLKQVADTAPRRLGVIASSSTKGEISVTFLFDSDGKLDGIEIASGDGPVSQPITAERRAALIDAACAAVRDEYVFPDKGAAMADAVAKARGEGSYDKVSDERALAEQLTHDFRAITNDRHLRVRIEPARDNGPHPTMIGPTEDEARRENWGFKSCSIEAGNVGVLRFDGFVPTEEAMRVADASLAFLGRCEALVFDLRSNGGGSPEMLCRIAGYLFAEPTLLNRMIDRSGTVIGEAFSDETVPGQRFPKDLPVYLLTSSRTFSCAEEFAYDLQALKRATLVGETTGGGAHPIKPVRLDERIIVTVPFLRANNPVTNSNWEGTGVQPEVAVPAEEALEKALELARTKIAERRAAAKPT